MAYLGSWAIDDFLTFYANTHAPSTGAATDADSVPTYRVYEDETATPILTGSMALLDTANTTGFYSERIQLTAANGFEKGKQYAVYVSATIGGVTATKHDTWQIQAEVDAATISDTTTVVQADVAQISGDSTAADNLELDYDGTGYAKANSTVGLVATATSAQLVDDIWDEALTSGTHDVGYSAGQRLRYLILSGATAQAGGASSITLANAESATDDIHSENVVSIVAGTGAGQTRLIIEYDGSSRVATVDRPWAVQPDISSVYELLPFAGILLAAHGAATAGGASTITLASTALAVADSYVGSAIYISAGAGLGQTRLITAYTAGRVATVSPAWDTQPDNTSAYKVLPVGRSIVESSNDKTGYGLTDGALTAAKIGANAITAAKIATGAIDADALATDAANEIADALLDRSNGIETSYTPRQALRLILAALAGKLSGAATSTVTIRDVGDTTDRIVATVDSSGNRTAVTKDVT